MVDSEGQEVKIGDFVKIVNATYNSFGNIGEVVKIDTIGEQEEAYLYWGQGNMSSDPWYGDEIKLAEPEDLI